MFDDIEPRFLILQRMNGRIVPFIQYGESKRTDRLIKAKQAERIPMTPIQAMRAEKNLIAIAESLRS